MGVDMIGVRVGVKRNGVRVGETIEPIEVTEIEAMAGRGRKLAIVGIGETAEMIAAARMVGGRMTTGKTREIANADTITRARLDRGTVSVPAHHGMTEGARQSRMSTGDGPPGVGSGTRMGT
jgi:hypothetical protein